MKIYTDYKEFMNDFDYLMTDELITEMKIDLKNNGNLILITEKSYCSYEPNNLINCDGCQYESDCKPLYNKFIRNEKITRLIKKS